jgi:hypothetical protein
LGGNIEQFLCNFFIQKLPVFHIGEPPHGEGWDKGGKEGEYDDFAFDALQANDAENMSRGLFPGNQKNTSPFR